jgi:cyclopropane-fatty-acyl-phospholipid synthase
MSSYFPTPLTTAITHGSDLLRTTLGSITWAPLLSASRAAATSLLSKIEMGTLVIDDRTSGRTVVFGQKIAKEHARAKMSNGSGVNGTSSQGGRIGKVELVVKRETFWVRLCLFGDMGFAEAYMLGEVECADLTGFFMV